MKTGLFISFEGIDGAGKTSHVQTLARALREAGREVIVTREPGGSELAESLRELVLHKSMDALTEALLVFAARRDHLRTCIVPALRAGAVVLSDRYTDASFAYQGGGRGLAWSSLQTLEQLVQDARALAPDLMPNSSDPAEPGSTPTGSPFGLGSGVSMRDVPAPAGSNGLIEPDLTLWFALPPEVAAQRLQGVRVPDRFESEKVDFFAQVHAAYQRRADAAPHRVVRIDASAELCAVWAQVRAAVQARGWLA